MPVTPEEVLKFWFGPGDGGHREAWFTRDEEFDRTVTNRFLEGYEEASRGEYDGWREDARGSLALVVLLDQFPRNMFRGDPRSYATDAKALQTAKLAIERAFDRELPPLERAFLYMPFMHSEDLEDQRRSVELFRRLSGVDDMDPARYAVAHMEIVERFGRFPHRNAVLDRETTPEEAEFLQSIARL
jgi:uncharacterized protein (DUF924 family)